MTKKSISGYFTFVKGNHVTKKSKKQKIVLRLSAEAKFWSMANGVCELLWIKSAFKDLEIEYTKLMNLHCDNKATIQITQLV